MRALLVVCLLAGPAAAQWPPPSEREPERFGDQGQVAIVQGTTLAVSYVSERYSDAQDPEPFFGFGLQLAADYVLAPRLTVGGTFVYSYEHQEPFTLTSISLSARVGYIIRASRRVSLWPQLAFGIVENEFTNADDDFENFGQTRFFGAVFAPILFHPADHFFVGAGPVASTDFSNDYDDAAGPLATRLGISTLLGGWF